MPLACDFIGFVNVTHVNLRKPDQQDEDHVAVDVKINGALEVDHRPHAAAVVAPTI